MELTDSIIRLSASKTPVEDRKLVTPAQLRTFAKNLRGVNMDFAAIELEDWIAQIVAKAEADDAELAAEREAAEAKRQAERAAAAARQEAYNNRPVQGVRPGDVLVDFGGRNTPRWASTIRHIGFKDEEGEYVTRCGADKHADYRARPCGDWAREATCKRCLKIAEKEGLL